MDNVRVIAGNALREVRHRRIVWLLVLVAGVIVLGSLSPLIFLRMAREAGETEIARRITGQLLDGVVGTWGFSAQLVALCLGATALATEVRSKTIVTLLARPVERWEYLVGRATGILLFAIVFFVVGLVMAAALALSFDTTPGMSFWLRAVEVLVGIVFVTAVSVGLGTLVVPAMAGTATFVLMILPGLARPLRGFGPAGDVAWWVAYVASPASMPDGVVGSSGADLVNPRYDLFAGVLLENLLYAAVVMLVTTALFARREIQLAG